MNNVFLSFNVRILEILIFLCKRPVMETRVQWVRKQPEMPGGSCPCCFLWCVYTLHSGIYSVRGGGTTTAWIPPSAPTASISSHFHSQSVLNVSHPLSLSVCLHCVMPWQLKCICHCSNSLYSPTQKLYHAFVSWHTTKERLSGSLDDVLMIFSRSIQRENCFSLNYGNDDWQ